MHRFFSIGWMGWAGRATARHHRDEDIPSETCTTLILKILTNHGASYSWPDRQTGREQRTYHFLCIHHDVAIAVDPLGPHLWPVLPYLHMVIQTHGQMVGYQIFGGHS